MVWDLRRALLKKEEFESARLMDFDFRQRARATRALARWLERDESELVQAIALYSEEELLTRLAQETGRDLQTLTHAYLTCCATARRDLIAERGDPTPHRLG